MWISWDPIENKTIEVEYRESRKKSQILSVVRGNKEKVGGLWILGAGLTCHTPLEIILYESLPPTSHHCILVFPFYLVVLLPEGDRFPSVPQETVAQHKGKNKKNAFLAFGLQKSLIG